MFRKLLAIFLFLFLVVLFFINSPTSQMASNIRLICEIEDQKINIHEKNFQIPTTIYWNRLNKITKITKNYTMFDISFENSYFYIGKDFILSKENDQFFVIDKRTENKNYLANGALALVSKDSNLFAIVQKNGLEITFFQFVPVEDRAIELKKEIFSSFYTFYEITKNSFYFSLMNGNCYIYNPFELISSENLVKDSPFIYTITANSSSQDYIIISGYNPQSISLMNKDGNLLLNYQLQKSHTSIYSHLLDNNLLVVKNNETFDIYQLSTGKDKKLKFLNSLNIKGDVIDLIEFYSALVFICTDGKDYQLVFYDYGKDKFYKKAWREPIFQLDIVDSNGVFVVYSPNKIWILSLNLQL